MLSLRRERITTRIRLMTSKKMSKLCPQANAPVLSSTLKLEIDSNKILMKCQPSSLWLEKSASAKLNQLN